MVVSGLITPALGWVGLGLDVLIVGLILFDARRAGTQDLRLERVLPASIHQHEPAAMEVRVSNPSDRPLELRIRDVLHPDLGPEPLRHHLRLAPRTTALLATELRPLKRGATALLPATARVLGPWQLGWHQRDVLPVRPVRVLPQAHLEGEAGLFVKQALRRRSGTNPREQRGVSTELYALREYQSGDAMNQIHWRASARRGRPVTRETVWEQHQQLAILLDCGRPMGVRAFDRTKLDHALAAVLALLRVVVKQNDGATLVMFSREIRRVVKVDRRTRGFAPIFEEVHADQADAHEPDYAAAAAWCARRLPRRSLVITITSLLDPLGAERLSGAMVGLARRHRPLVLNLEDPALVTHARANPSNTAEAASKISALAMVSQLAGLTSRMRGSGVDVLDLPADRLAIGLVQKYLDHKARG